MITNWNNLSSTERIEHWKEFRKKIQHLSSNQKIQETAKFWSTLPLGHRSIDYYTPESWPTPWEILYHGWFCENTASLMMYYTLRLQPDFAADSINIWLVDCEGNIFIVPVIDDTYVLNYIPHEITKFADYQKDIKVVDKFQSSRIKKIV